MEAYLNKVTIGDMIELSRQIPDESVDLIFTDPPYPKEFWYLYDELSKVAERVLKSGAPCFVYTGNDNLEYAMHVLGMRLKYRAVMPCIHRNGTQIVWSSRIVASFKPILVYHKGSWSKESPIIFPPASTMKDKQFHEWGQSEEEAMHYVIHHSNPGDIVLDPFCGGGTTAVVCKLTGRQFITFEVVPSSANIAIGRLNRTTSGVYTEQLELVSEWMQGSLL